MMNAKQTINGTKPERIAPQTVFPRIKHESFLASLADMEVAADEMPLTQPLVGDLIITYAVDDGPVFRMVSAGDVAALGVSQARVHEVALANLRRRVSLNVGGQPPVLVLQCGENFEACMLLLDEVWPQLAAHLPGEVVVAVPTHNIVFVTGSASPEGLLLVRQAAAECYGQPGTYGLSTHLFVRRADRWEVFE